MTEQQQRFREALARYPQSWVAALFEMAAPMTTPVTVWDCIGTALPGLTVPPGVLMAAYITGSAGVPWTNEQLAAHPASIRIDQSPDNTTFDETADVYDLEANAGTLANLAEWVHNAWTSYKTGKAPGQRTPTVYQSLSNVTATVNELLRNGITNGVNLWVAGPMTDHAAMDLVAAANGPFPIVGVQYEFHDMFDVSVFSSAWLQKVSVGPVPPKPQPGTQAGWAFCHRCQGLFYGPGMLLSVCPAGGHHDDTHSHSYTLGFNW